MPAPRGDETLESRPSLPERVIGALAAAAAAAAAALVLLTLATVSYSVFKRYVLGTPVTWTDELSGYLVVAIVMLGAADALRRGDHISVDLLSSRARGPGRRVLGVWAMLAVALLGAALIYSAVRMVRFSFDFGIYSDGYLALAMWIPQSLVLLGAALLVLMALARVVTLLQGRAPR